MSDVGDVLWDEMVAKRHELGLREMADAVGRSPGEIAGMLREAGLSKVAQPRSERSKAVSVAPRRRGTMKSLVDHHETIGTVSDGVIAERAGVSVQTVANYRKKHGIKSFRRKGSVRTSSRGSVIDAHAELLGSVPDARIAERAGVSVAAVRAYRVRRGIPSWRSGAGKAVGASPAPKAIQMTARDARTTPASGRQAWSVTYEDGRVGVCAADTIASAAAKAEGLGRVTRIEWVGAMLD